MVLQKYANHKLEREKSLVDLNVSNLFGLKNKVAIVTGASDGIGKEIALVLADFGADIALIARNNERLETVYNQIKSKGRQVYKESFDLNNTDKIPELVENIYNYFGRIDILINNAGMNIAKDAEDVTEHDWDKQLDLNLKSVFFLTQSVGEYMKKRHAGKVVNVSSQMAFVGYYKRAVYSTTKGGLTQLTKALSIEWADYNINVNAIAPTFIETPMTKQMLEEKSFKEDVLSKIPLNRLAKIEDLFGAFIYLSSNASDMVTGHTLVIDGGWTVW